MEASPPDHLSTGAAAQRLGISRYTLLRAMHRGEIMPATRTPGGYARFHVRDVEALAQRLRPTRPRLLGQAAPEHGAYDALTCGVLVLDAMGRISSLNPAAEEILGVSFSQVCGHTLSVLQQRAIGPGGADLSEADQPAMIALRTGRPQYRVVLRVLRLDGRERWLQVDAVPVLDKGGVARVVVTFADFTQHRHAEEPLRASEEHFRRLIDTAPIGTCILDEEGRFETVNDTYSALCGYAPDELLGRHFTLLFPEAAREATAQTYARNIGAGIERQGEFTVVTKDGALLTILSTSAMLTGPDGRPKCAFFVVDITTRKREEQRLDYLAHHDALTGLPNRVLLQDRLAQALRLAERQGTSLALLLIDLDRFKEVNDTLGHDCGDALLHEVSNRMQEAMRASDTVARLGGDEFAILLPATDAAGAEHVADKILSALTDPIQLHNHALEVGASIGIGLAPLHGSDAATLLRCADVAMYVAKRTGGGHAVYTPEQDQHTLHRLTLAAELRRAIAHNQLRLHYQPVVDLSSGRPTSVEALVRWQHPQQGLLSPDRFIPLVEETGLITPLTVWALDEALRQCRAWTQAGLPIGVAVNVSPRTLHDATLPDTITDLLARHALPPHRLTLEITESIMMVQPDRAQKVLERLKALGIRLALDDFGTGYSSLSLLHRLPVDDLKIDRSFVVALASADTDSAIVAFIMGLGHTLGLRVVAEGVESQGMWDLLSAVGCDAAQGYFVSHPLSAAETGCWLRETVYAAA